MLFFTRPYAICLLSALCPLLAGCPAQRVGNRAASTEQGLRIAVTVKPLALIAAPLLEEEAQVNVLLPAGSDAHNFEPRPSNTKQVSEADALLWIGPDLDSWAVELGARQTLEVGALVPEDARRVFAGANHSHAGHSHGPEDYDPHFWSDPLVVAVLMPALAQALAELDPTQAADYTRRGQEAVAEMRALHNWASEILAPLRGKRVIQMHPSLNYLLARYGIESVGVVEEVAGSEPSAKELASLVEIAKWQQVSCIITEPQLSEKAARTVATEVGVKVVELDPEASGETDFASYAEWFRWNVEQLAGALK